MEENANKEKGKWTKMKVIRTVMLLVIAIGLIVAACFYVYFVQYYTEHLYDGTLVNGIDCSDMTEEQVEEVLQNELNGYAITLKGRENVSSVINAQDISLTYENDGSLKDLYIIQQPLLWGIRVFGEKTYEVPSGFVYNEDQLRACFEKFKHVKDYVPMKDAELVQNEDGTYRIDPEVVGTEMTTEEAYTALVDAVTDHTEELDLEEFYLSPVVLADDPELVEELEYRNLMFSLTRANILVQFGEEQTTIDSKLLESWIVKDKVEKYKIDETAVRKFVQDLYDKYNVGHEGKLFKTRTGRVVFLENLEQPGWNIDIDKSYERYMNAIKEGYQGVLGPVMTRPDENGNETATLYVEISLDEQMMWLIQDGEILVETPIVSGGADTHGEDLPIEWIIADFNSRSTPSNGIWAIKKKESPHFMKGPMLASGVYEYTLDTTYWLPFNDLIGIHDNYQRVKFGGKIYQTAGSHGCINTPFEAVEKIYNTVEPGTLVILYGMDKGEDVFAPEPEEHAENAESADAAAAGQEEAPAETPAE